MSGSGRSTPDQASSDQPAADEGTGHRKRLTFPRFRWFLLGALLVVILLWVIPVLVDTIQTSDGIEGVDRPYLLTFAFVAFDAVIPIFPSESLLTTASAAAAQDGSDIILWLLIVAGALGAIVGDSMLYWIARTVGQKTVAERLEQAKQNEKVRTGFQVLGSTAPLLIMAGRFVPGLRFVVNATMGLSRYPYPKFLLFSAIGGTAWAAYTCLFSFFIGNALEGYPVLSIATSVVVTTALLALMYLPLKKRYEAAQDEPTDIA